MGIGEQIETIVTSMTGNNIPPEIITIRKAYTNNTADITTKGGVLKNVRCSGKAEQGTAALLVYENGDMQSPFILLFHDIEKQDVLVSGTNIKTINSESLLGSGNIDIGGGGDLSAYVKKEDVTFTVSLEDNGTMIFNLGIGDD